jgi:hypothetical protein
MKWIEENFAQCTPKGFSTWTRERKRDWLARNGS